MKAQTIPILFMLMLAMMMCGLAAAWAQEIGSVPPADRPVAAADADAPAAVPAPAPERDLDASLPPAPTDAQGLNAAKQAAEQFTAAKALSGAARRKAILLGLAAAFTALIYVLRRWVVLFLNKQAVAALAVVLGAVVFVLSHVAAGNPPWQSVEVALAGPGSMALYAVLQLLRPKAWARARARAKEKAAAKRAAT